MNTLKQTINRLENSFRESRDSFFGRTIDDILENDFFNSFNANIRDDHDSYRLEIAVPGMSRKDITLEIDQSIMRISAQRQKKRKSWNTVEFATSEFHRSFVLPADADINKVKAKCRDGILTIRIGKVKDLGTHRRIKIQDDVTENKRSGRMFSWWETIKHNVRQLFK
jgi:HSP20 family protein